MTDVPKSIEFVDLKAQYARLKDEIEARIAAVLAHGKFILGPEVGELEEALATFAGAGHAVGVASGTDALQIVLMAEGIGPGDAVFIPSFTFTATAEIVVLLGATPVFVDVDERSFNIDVLDLERRVEATRRSIDLTPKAIIAVDLFGQPADYTPINDLAASHGMLAEFWRDLWQCTCRHSCSCDGDELLSGEAARLLWRRRRVMDE